MDRAEAATLRPFASALLLSYSPKGVEKLFGKSGWVPNRGSESGQEGSKESRSAISLAARSTAETPLAIFQTVSPKLSDKSPKGVSILRLGGPTWPNTASLLRFCRPAATSLGPILIYQTVSPRTRANRRGPTELRLFRNPLGCPLQLQPRRYLLGGFDLDKRVHRAIGGDEQIVLLTRIKGSGACAICLDSIRAGVGLLASNLPVKVA